jgi:hypothetical protein
VGERTNGSGHKKDGASHGLTTLTVRFKYAALPAASTAVKRTLKPVWFAGVGCEVLMAASCLAFAVTSTRPSTSSIAEAPKST